MKILHGWHHYIFTPAALSITLSGHMDKLKHRQNIEYSSLRRQKMELETLILNRRSKEAYNSGAQINQVAYTDRG